VRLIGLAPASDRVVVEIERLGDLLAAPAVVKQKQGVRPSRQALLAMAVAQQRQQFSALARRKKPAANQASSRIRKPSRRKPLFAPSMSPGICRRPYDSFGSGGSGGTSQGLLHWPVDARRTQDDASPKPEPAQRSPPSARRYDPKTTHGRAGANPHALPLLPSLATTTTLSRIIVTQ